MAASRSTCSRLHVGAVIVSNYNVLGTGYNGAARGIKHCLHNDNSPCRVSVHAEANALLHARYTEGKRTMYVTHAPCFDCSKLIINSGIDRVCFAQYYRSCEGEQLLEEANIRVERILI